MKKNLYPIIFFFLIFIVSGFTLRTENAYSNSANTEISTCNYGQCRATAKSTGNRCRHCVSNSGDWYCFQHK